MTKLINLSKSPTKEFHYISHDEYIKKFNKGWSFSYTYSLIELKNIYLLLKNVGFKNLSDFTKHCIKNKLFYEKTAWNERRVLEQVNALVNFGLITETKKIADESNFSNSELDDKLSAEDLSVFSKIYFSYYRFKEIHSWLIDSESYSFDELLDKINQEYVENFSKPIFPFRSNDRFTDTFIFELNDNTTVYKIGKSDKKTYEGIKRFWDVFVTWGTSLGLAEKFNLADLNYKFSNNFKSPPCFYFHKPLDHTFSLIDYLQDNYKVKYVYIPKLVLALALEYRFSINDIKQLILKTATANSDAISLQKTSEILMRKTELKFIPKSNGFLFSHILRLN
ncbi:MAG: hypothetical protein M3Q99_07015 [Acidobacteriota bacterium]|nr:hypothetical protein [Acidobacteriota bacterium]